MDQNIISAVFDDHSQAEAAIRELRSAGAGNDCLSIIGRHESRTSVTDGGGDAVDDDSGSDALKGALGGAGIGAILGVAALAIPGVGPLAAAGAIASSAIPGAAALGAGAGAVAGGLSGLLKNHGVSDDDASYYEGRINEGGTFVSVDSSACGIPAETAREILISNGGHNASQPRTESRKMAHDSTNDRTTERGSIVEEERIPVVEEKLEVGKREVEQGGARVRSFVEERPVSEDVNLREEHVNVERRPVDEPISPDALDRGLLEEREIEMRETAERPVVGKEARVKEEVVVQKTADEHTEQVGGTVRNTKVEVDEARADDDRSAMGFGDDRQSTSERSREFDPSTGGRT